MNHETQMLLFNLHKLRESLLESLASLVMAETYSRNKSSNHQAVKIWEGRHQSPQICGIEKSHLQGSIKRLQEHLESCECLISFWNSNPLVDRVHETGLK